MEFVTGLLLGCLSGGFFIAACLRERHATGPRQTVVGSGRYMRAISRERNERYGRCFQEATEAARNARGW